ncbi:GNAT family N-acetyltransferase [Corynebacterium amycolatum]|uniref:GNAT family N-acetyltransferase n=1 Tax=Corynebacterium amycolatum TaxID=43765 RepID=UPI003B5B0E2A
MRCRRSSGTRTATSGTSRSTAPCGTKSASCTGHPPHDLGYHIAIGRPELTGRGIFGRFMAELGPAMLRSDPECEKLAVEPDYRNTVVHKILRGAGWRDEGEFDARPDRRIRLFTYERGTGR